MSKITAHGKKVIETKSRHGFEKAPERKAHPKGIFSFMKKKNQEKKWIKEGMKQDRKQRFFARFRKKNETLPNDGNRQANDKKLNLFSFFKKKEAQKKERVIERYKGQLKKKQRQRETIQERRHRLLHYIEKSGLSLSPQALSKTLFNVCVLINLGISAFLIYHFSVTFGITWTTILLSIASLWVLVFAIILFIMWVGFYVVVDLKIFKRKVDIEEVLPDYLQLTASNIKAGMTIDRALWYAVRPRFGVLANEIEIVAKETMRGEDLKVALRKFADKYDSVLLKRSISLLIEGIEAGGEIGNLLDKIAVNVQENRIMRKEMAANVTTYIIFISFATLIAAPVLFALAGILIRVITNLGSTLGGAGLAASTSGFGIGFSGTGIEYTDFRIFAIVSLLVSSFFSAIIISAIKKGNVKFGFRYIPMFMVITITLFFLADIFLGKIVGVFL